MALPTNREEFLNYCLKHLGAPVVKINGAQEQFEDRIDDAISYYQDYHMDATYRCYFKHQLEQKDYPDSVQNIYIKNGGTAYSNADVITFASGQDPLKVATGSIVTDNVGKIIQVINTPGQTYRSPPVITITTTTGSGAVLESELGGFFNLPDDIIGAPNIFDVGPSNSAADIFSARYQFIMNEMYSLSNLNIAPYYMQMQKLQLIQQVLVGKQPIRYSRHMNRFYLDMDYKSIRPGHWLVIECFRAIDPNRYPDVWKDRWLLRYATQLIKRQYGTNLSKYSGVAMLGNITFNGQQLYEEADAEIRRLEDEMITSYSLPSYDYIG